MMASLSGYADPAVCQSDQYCLIASFVCLYMLVIIVRLQVWARNHCFHFMCVCVYSTWNMGILVHAWSLRVMQQN